MAPTSSYRGLVVEALTETAVVLSSTWESDQGGGATAEISESDGVRCRVDALSGDEEDVASRISDRSTHLATFPAGTPVTGSDDLRIEGRGTFEITAVREHTGEFARFVEVVKH